MRSCEMRRYANAGDYPEVAKRAVAEMVRQTGEPLFENGDENLLMRRGTIVRHLALPGQTEDSKRILRYLHDTYGERIYISIMNQYTPVRPPEEFPELGRKLSEAEYEALVDYAVGIGIENGFIQEGETAEESFIPEFDLEGV